MAACGLAVHLVACGFYLAAYRGDPSAFVHFGSEMALELAHARAVLGEVQTPNEDGHDGVSFWTLARDPLLLEPEDAQRFTDRPQYRAQRIGYPMLAAPWRLLGERALLWGLLLTNLVAVFAGGYASARLARALGMPERASLAFAMNPGVFLAVLFDLSDAVALLFVVCTALAMVRGRVGWAVVASTAAALTKEPTLFATAALAASYPWGVRGAGGAPLRPLGVRARMLVAVVPVVACGLWAVYVRARLGWRSAPIEEFDVPLAGYLDAWRRYWAPARAYGEAALSTAVLLTGAAIVVRFWRRRTFLLAAALPYALLSWTLTIGIVHLMTNFLRAFAPALFFLVFDLYAARANAPAR